MKDGAIFMKVNVIGICILICFVATFFILPIHNPFFKSYGLIDSWIQLYGGIFGNIIGGIIGGYVAFLIATHQINKQKENESENYRSYITGQHMTSKLALDDLKTPMNSRILYTEELEDLLTNPALKGEKDKELQFYKFEHYGLSDIILDCVIEIEFTTKNCNDIIRVNANSGVVEKGIELFIPLSRKGRMDLSFLKVTFEYTTIKGERLRYFNTAESEGHLLVKPNGKTKIINVLKRTINNDWIYPNRI
jgi:hypothetical protein